MRIPPESGAYYQVMMKKANQAIARDPRKGPGLNRQPCLTCPKIAEEKGRKGAKTRPGKLELVCIYANCNKPRYAKGLCRPHYHWERAQQNKMKRRAA